MVQTSHNTLCYICTQYIHSLLGSMYCLANTPVIHKSTIKFSSKFAAIKRFLKASGFTKVGVTRCGNWWCHAIFSSKKWRPFVVIVLKSSKLFSNRHHSHPLRLPSHRLSSILDTKFFRISLRCHPGQSTLPRLPLVMPLFLADVWPTYFSMLRLLWVRLLHIVSNFLSC